MAKITKVPLKTGFIALLSLWLCNTSTSPYTLRLLGVAMVPTIQKWTAQMIDDLISFNPTLYVLPDWICLKTKLVKQPTHPAFNNDFLFNEEKGTLTFLLKKRCSTPIKFQHIWRSPWAICLYIWVKSQSGSKASFLFTNAMYSNEWAR